MDLPNPSSSSSVPQKRKRGRPRRDENQTQQQVNPPVTTTTTDDENLIGRVVSGVVEGSFEAGYFLNVKVVDSETHLRGVVFLPEKVIPVTPSTDLFPQAKMYAREDLPVPSFNQQTPSQGKTNAANQTDEIGSEPRTDDLIAGKNHPMDTQMKDVGGSSSEEEKLTEPEGQTLSLMPQYACEARPEATQKKGTGSSSTLGLELFQNETMRSGTEEEKSLAEAEPCGMEDKQVDDVPEELQLELGNKKMSASPIATEANPASSKSGFLGNLFEGREVTEEPNAASESVIPEPATQVGDNDS